MSDEKIPVNRTAIGVLAGLMLFAAAVMWAMGATQGSAGMWQAGCVRVGLVLTAIWIAMPTRNREAAWAHISVGTLLGIGVALFALMRLPLRIVLPAFVLVATIGIFLRPRQKRRARPRSSPPIQTTGKVKSAQE